MARKSSIFVTPKVTLGRVLKKMCGKCKERLWEHFSPQELFTGSPHFPPAQSPLEHSGVLGGGEEGSGEMPSFWLGAGLDHGWLVAAGPSHLLV